MKKEILKYTLKQMEDKKIPLTKINIQKIVFFLKEVNIPINYKFEPYLYGPYSSDLASDLKYMERWDEIIFNNDNNSGYELKDNIKLESIDDMLINNISDRLDSFKEALKNDFSFDSMEISGTVIYCIRALQNFGREVSENAVLKEFKNWKGTRYPDIKIKMAYSNIKDMLD